MHRAFLDHIVKNQPYEVRREINRKRDTFPIKINVS